MNINDNSPFFSVIIPAYNREKTIRRAMESVLRQTFKLFEIVVIDDGSSDNTEQIVAEMIEQDKRIRYICQENQGAQIARNRGINEAIGEWIAFLDSDDEWVSDKLEVQFEALKKENFNPYTVVHGNCLVKDLINKKEEIWDFSRVAGNNIYPQVMCSGGALFPNIVTSKKALEEIGLLDVNVPAFQEWDTSIALAKHCKFIAINSPLFIYYLHKGPTISKDRLREIKGFEYIIRKYKGDVIAHCGYEAWKELLCAFGERCFELNFPDKAEEIYYEAFGEKINVDAFIDDIKERVKNVDRIYCYGAGKIGEFVGKFFEQLNIRIDSFVVSAGQPTGVLGKTEIKCIDDITDRDSALFIVSTDKDKHNAIMEQLSKYGGSVNAYLVTNESRFLMSAVMALSSAEKDTFPGGV